MLSPEVSAVAPIASVDPVGPDVWPFVIRAFGLTSVDVLAL
jgi:hypothetical protein